MECNCDKANQGGRNGFALEMSSSRWVRAIASIGAFGALVSILLLIWLFIDWIAAQLGFSGSRFRHVLVPTLVVVGVIGFVVCLCEATVGRKIHVLLSCWADKHLHHAVRSLDRGTTM